MYSLLRGAVGEDVRYALKTSIAFVMVSDVHGYGAENACLGFNKIIVAGAHIVHQHLACTFILFWKFYRALNEFRNRFSICTWSLQEGPFPTRWPGTFVLLVRDDTGLNFILHDR